MRAVAIILVGTVLALGGCSSGSPEAEPASASSSDSATEAASATPSASDTPTPTPSGPMVLSEEEAGDMFLAATCPVYAASDKFNKALEANGEIDKVSGKPASGTRKAARTASKKMETGAEMLTDDAYEWPKEVRKDVKAVAQAYYENASVMNRIAAKGFTWDEWRGDEWVSAKEDVAAVRLELGLGASPKGC